ncbi:MAG: tetratricopeptide repeat protein, partial [Alphaproteobacteria bacterium]|nr:tetratricopeptide repeat protein [Alphaproteobacteria bacterium]
MNDSAIALYRRAMSLAQAGRLAEALAELDRALALQPDFADGQRNRADLLLSLKREAEAYAAYETYLRLRPADAQGWSNRGIAATELRLPEEAVICFDKALALDPRDADAWNNRANALFELKRFADAARDYEKALKLAPDLPYADGFLLQSRLRCCDWGTVTPHRKRIAGGVSRDAPVIDPFGNLAVSDSPSAQLQCARIWIADGHQAASPLWRDERYGHERIRIAYVSGDFRPHPVAFLIAGVFEHHDRARFETIGVSLGAAGESEL